MLIRDGRVAVIEPAGSRKHEGVRILDGTGQTLLPGLVDAHLHFTIPGGLARTGAPRTDVADLTAQQLLRSGVTSGRLHLASLEDAASLKARSASPCAAVPRLQVGGPGMSGAAPQDFSNFWGAKTPDEAVAKVERQKAAGMDWIAIHDADKFAPGVLPALAAAARRSGIRLMAAGSTPAEIEAALSVSPDTLDYIDSTASPAYLPATLDQIRAARDLVLVPTPGVPYRAAAYAKDPTRLDDQANFEFLTPDDRAHVLAVARKDLLGDERTRAERRLPSLPEKLRQLRTLGVPVAIGSDAGSPLHFQAGAIWWELEAWRAMGASHRDALVAATEGTARVLRAADIGRLEPGSRADFILYRGDVERGPFDLSRVLAVGKGGVLFVSNARWLAP